MPDAEWMKTAFNYGVPCGILIAFGLIGYRFSLCIGSFMAPIIKEISSKHLQTMETFDIVGKGLLQQQEAQTELMKRHDSVLGEHSTKIDEIHRVVVRR